MVEQVKNPITAPRRQLGQARPAVTTAVTAWNVPYFGQYDIHLINVVNTSTSETIAISIFHDPDGTTYDLDTALVYEYSLGPGDVFQFEARGSVNGYLNSGSIGVQSDTADAANFKIYGALQGETVVPV